MKSAYLNHKEYLRLVYYLLQNRANTKKFNFSKVIIIAPVYVVHIAQAIQLLIWSKRVDCIILDVYKTPEVSDALYIVICPQAFSRLPVKRIVYQLEQWPSKKYFSISRLIMLKKSIAVLDYSRLNSEILEKIVSRKSSYFWLPVSPSGCQVIPRNEKEFLYDLVFYGAINKKREVILNSIGKNFKLKIIDNLVGDDLRVNLISAKFCLNIHYFESALFEAVRFSQCINFGLPMLSEISRDQNDYIGFSNVLKFIDFSNEKIYLNSIENLVASKNTKNIKINKVKSESFSNFTSNFDRIMSLIGVDFDRGVYLPN